METNSSPLNKSVSSTTAPTHVSHNNPRNTQNHSINWEVWGKCFVIFLIGSLLILGADNWKVRVEKQHESATAAYVTDSITAYAEATKKHLPFKAPPLKDTEGGDLTEISIGLLVELGIALCIGALVIGTLEISAHNRTMTSVNSALSEIDIKSNAILDDVNVKTNDILGKIERAHREKEGQIRRSLVRFVFDNKVEEELIEEVKKLLDSSVGLIRRNFTFDYQVMPYLENASDLLRCYVRVSFEIHNVTKEKMPYEFLVQLADADPLGNQNHPFDFLTIKKSDNSTLLQMSAGELCSLCSQTSDIHTLKYQLELQPGEQINFYYAYHVTNQRSTHVVWRTILPLHRCKLTLRISDTLSNLRASAYAIHREDLQHSMELPQIIPGWQLYEWEHNHWMLPNQGFSWYWKEVKPETNPQSLALKLQEPQEITINNADNNAD